MNIDALLEREQDYHRKGTFRSPLQAMLSITVKISSGGETSMHFRSFPDLKSYMHSWLILPPAVLL